jgi:hypothetical protein
MLWSSTSVPSSSFLPFRYQAWALGRIGATLETSLTSTRMPDTTQVWTVVFVELWYGVPQFGVWVIISEIIWGLGTPYERFGTPNCRYCCNDFLALKWWRSVQRYDGADGFLSKTHHTATNSSGWCHTLQLDGWLRFLKSSTDFPTRTKFVPHRFCKQSLAHTPCHVR